MPLRRNRFLLVFRTLCSTGTAGWHPVDAKIKRSLLVKFEVLSDLHFENKLPFNQFTVEVEANQKLHQKLDQKLDQKFRTRFKLERLI